MADPAGVQDATLRLLEATIERHVDPTASNLAARTLPIGAGLSGDEVRRYEVSFDGSSGGRAVVRLVTKRTIGLECQVVGLLNDQGQPNVPFGHSLGLEADGAALLCLQDVGDQRRPTSLEPIPPELLDAEADALAAIHGANLGRDAALAWLPRAGHDYVHEMIERRFFRPAWNRAIGDPAFLREFGSAVPGVEAAAARILDDMVAVFAEGDTLTLVHTDINPSNVLVRDGVPYIVDWATAHYGSCYLDVPHHFPTLALAERYRVALGARGIQIPPDRFAERHRAAARYVGLRYVWWTLDAWREDRSLARWVWHYLGMVLGNR